MVKRKSLPKKGSEAGLAANEAPPVLDRTRDLSNEKLSTSNSEDLVSKIDPRTSSSTKIGANRNSLKTKIIIERQRRANYPTQIDRISKKVEKKNIMKIDQLRTQKLNKNEIVVGRNENNNANGTNIKNKLVKMSKTQQGLKVLQEIKRYQSTTQLLIPKAPFLRLIRELIHTRSNDTTFKITKDAVDALREASEVVLTSLFEDAYLLSLHAKRVTLMPRDMVLLLRLKHDNILYP